MSGALGLPQFPHVPATETGWVGSAWFEQLQPGSWRGVPFVMDTMTTAAGRRLAVHEYPYRDEVWAEDLGKLPRRFALVGFLVGDDVYQQRDAMLAACEQEGPGPLVHPTMGPMTCVLMSFSVADRREHGRVVEFTAEFVLAGDLLTPAIELATGQAVNDAVESVRAATGFDMNANYVRGTLQAVPLTAQFSVLATAAVEDPTRALNAVRGMPGLYGRFAGGNLALPLPASSTVASLMAAATVQRTGVYNAAASLNVAAGQL